MRIATATLAIVTVAGSCLAQDFYLDRLSAAPGDRVRVHVAQSSAIEVWRTRYFGQDTRLLQTGTLNATTTAKVRGSHATVPTNPALEITSDLTLEAWVRPFNSGGNGFHGILSKYSVPDAAAYNLYLMPGGQLSFYLGATGVFSVENRTVTTGPIPYNAWTHVVATYDGQFKRIYLNGQLDVAAPRTGPIFNTAEPVRVASYGINGSAGETFNGEIDSPAIYNRALTPIEIERRAAERANYTEANPGVLSGAVAQWNFGERDGTTLVDATGKGRDLTLVNYGTRGVPGPSPRLGPNDSHSIRFSKQDLTDLDWPSPYSFVIEPSWGSGLYYVRIGGQRAPLIVNPAPSARSRIAVLAATNTWHAYNSWSGNSMYTTHSGSPGPISYYVNMRQPNPGVQFQSIVPGSGAYAHLLDAERFLYKWLDDNGYPFDLYTDLDLHKNPNLLDSYDVLMLNGHNEYWSHEMVDHVEAFQAQGGSVVNLSGNTMWSLVTYDPTFSIIEGRKHPHGSGTIPAGERWHSQAGSPLGGTMRCIGRPEHEVIGTGYGVIVSAPNFGWGKVLQPSHWVFRGTGATLNSLFGQQGLNGGGMFGHESDVVLPQWTPPNTVVLARAQYPINVGSLHITNCQSRSSSSVTEGGDVIYFDHPGGGGVFGIPSVAAGGSLMVDPVSTRMLRNVLDRFLDNATCALRNGSGVNPLGFACTTMPVLGATWTSSVERLPQTTSTFLGLSATLGEIPFGGGEILIGLVPQPLFQQGAGTHSIPIPNVSNLLGAALHAQGFRIDMPAAPRFTMLNAQDLKLGF